MVIELCDSLPENAEGGKEFFIHQVNNTTIAITEIGKGKDERVLEVERTETGELEIRSLRDPERVIPVAESGREACEAIHGKEQTNHDQTFEPDPEDDPADIIRFNKLRNKIEASNRLRVGNSTPTLTRLNNENTSGKGRLCTTETNEDDENEKTENLLRNLEEGNAGSSIVRPKADDQLRYELIKDMGISFPTPKEVKNRNLPRYPSNALLAIRELVPIVRYDNENNDFEFYARGVTLATDEGSGKASYRGNALIRISGRDQRPGPRLPSRRRTEFYRQHLFRTNANQVQPQDEKSWNLPEMYHKRTKPDNLEDDRVHHRKEVIGDNGVEMTKDEIEAMMDELMSNPVEGIHTERTYEIKKNQDGAVKVTRLPPENLTLEGIGGRTKEKEVSKRIDEEIEKRTLCLNWITRFGSDPPTSDRQSMGADERKKSKSRKSRPNWSKPSKVVGHEVDRVPIKYLDTSIHSPEDGKHIKEEEEAHQDVVQKVLSPLSSDLPSSKITPCLKTMSVNPLPQAMAPPTPPPTLPQKNRKVKYLPPKAPDPEGSGSFGIAPCPSDTRPGILAAAHLAKIPFQGSSHPEPSFFAFGSTIV